MSYAIGYFGAPGKIGGKVHLVKFGRPVCGAQHSKKAEFRLRSSAKGCVAYEQGS